jgi:hypothetical protein
VKPAATSERRQVSPRQSVYLPGKALQRRSEAEDVCVVSSGRGG